MGSCKTRVKVGELSGNSCPCFKHQFYTYFTPVACKIVQLLFLVHFLNNFVFPFLFTKLLSEMSEKYFLLLNSSYTCILRVFYVSIDNSLTNFCGQKNVILTLNLCNFTLRLAQIFKHKSNIWNSGFSRVFYVSIDTSFTNFFRQKNVVPTLNLCSFTVRLGLGIYKKIFEQISNK